MSWVYRCQVHPVYPTVEHHPARNLQHETLQTTFDMFDQSQYLLHTLEKSFFVFQLCFYFLEIIKHTKNVVYFLPSSILKWLHKNSPIYISFFKMHADKTAVTTQSNKIVLIEKTTKHYYSHVMEKWWMNFLANPILLFLSFIMLAFPLSDNSLKAETLSVPKANCLSCVIHIKN